MYVIQHQTRSSMSLWTLFCALVCSPIPKLLTQSWEHEIVENVLAH